MEIIRSRFSITFPTQKEMTQATKLLVNHGSFKHIITISSSRGYYLHATIEFDSEWNNSVNKYLLQAGIDTEKYTASVYSQHTI